MTKQEYATLDQLVKAITELEATGEKMSMSFPGIVLPLTAAILKLTAEVKVLKAEVAKLKSVAVA